MRLKQEEIAITQEYPFKEDLLNRKECANILTQIVQHTEGGFTLSINADWGYGKTTFVKMWEKVLQKAGYQTIYFNAWESDFVADPMMALVDGIIEAINEELPEDKKAFLKALIKSIVGMAKLVPALKGAADVAEAIIEGTEDFDKADSEIQEYRGLKTLVENFREKLLEYAKSVGGNKQLIIFVDELDRCRPDYAVQMLERIKHFFAIDNIIFVLSIDKHVMCESIRAIYGGLGIDTEAYLRRFIDLEFALPEPNIKEYIDALCEQKQFASYFKGYDDYLRQANYHEDTEYTLRNALIHCFQSERRSLRDVEKYFNRLLILLHSVHFPHSKLDLAAFMLYTYMFDKPLYNTLKQMQVSIPALWSELEKLLNNSLLDSHSNEYKGYLAMLIACLAFYIRDKRDIDGGKDPIYREIEGNAELDWFNQDQGNQRWLRQEVISANTTSLDLKTLCKHMELLTIMFKEEPEKKQEEGV